MILLPPSVSLLSVVNLWEDFKVFHHPCNEFPELNSLRLQYLCFLLLWLTHHNKINLPLQTFIEHLLLSHTEKIPHCLSLTGHPQSRLCSFRWIPNPHPVPRHLAALLAWVSSHCRWISNCWLQAVRMQLLPCKGACLLWSQVDCSSTALPPAGIFRSGFGARPCAPTTSRANFQNFISRLA